MSEIFFLIQAAYRECTRSESTTTVATITVDPLYQVILVQIHFQFFKIKCLRIIQWKIHVLDHGLMSIQNRIKFYGALFIGHHNVLLGRKNIKRKR